MLHLRFLRGTLLQTFLCLSVFFFVTNSVYAADEGFRLTLSPLPINLTVDPGTSVSTQLRVKNDGSQTETLRIDRMKFNADGETGSPGLFDRESDDAFLDWVHFSEDTFSLEPNQWKTINATFDVPDTAAFGYYYAFVFSRAGAEEQPLEARQTRVLGGTAILVLLEAKVPHAKREVTVTSFQVDKKWYEFLPATFTIKLKNTGNVHVAPRGNIFIGRPGEKEDTLIEVNIGKGNILPASSRFFDAEWNDGFPIYRDKEENGKMLLDEKNQPIQELRWDFKDASKLRFGKYEAKLLLVYDDGERDIPIEGSVQFWVLPWRLIGVCLLIGLFVLIGIKSTTTKLWRHFFKTKISE